MLIKIDALTTGTVTVSYSKISLKKFLEIFFVEPVLELKQKLMQVQSFPSSFTVVKRYVKILQNANASTSQGSDFH